MILEATINGQLHRATLQVGVSAYARVPGLKWHDGETWVTTWIGQAPLVNVATHQAMPLRAVHLVRLRKGETLPAWVLLWNGDVDHRVGTFVVDQVRVIDVDGSVRTPFDPMPRELADGTFLAIPIGAVTRLFAPAARAVVTDVTDVEGQALAPDALVAITEAADRLQPWVDEETNTEVQGSPGSCRLVRTEALLIGALQAGLLTTGPATWPAWSVGCLHALTMNAVQEGRRRLHYFRFADDGRLCPMRLADVPGALGIDPKLGLLVSGQDVVPGTGHVLVDGQLEPVVYGAGEQHFFRLANHADAFAVTGDPLFWLVGHGLMQYAAGSKIGKPVQDVDGNQRRAWVPFAAARWARRMVESLVPSPERSMAGLLEDAEQVVHAWLDKVAVWKKSVELPTGPFPVLSINLQPSRGHHGATWVAFQAAVQCLAVEEIRLADATGAIPLADHETDEVAEMAVDGIVEAVRLRQIAAPMDSGPWGSSTWTPAYDVVTALSPQLEAPGVLGSWWHSKTGAGYAGTYLWPFEAALRAAPAGTMAAEAFRAGFHAACPGLRVSDSAFPDLLATALLAAKVGLPINP